MLDFIVAHWGIVAFFLTQLTVIAGYFTKQWRDIEAIKQENARCELERKAEMEERKKLATKLDDFHIAAVAREERHKQEVTNQTDKVRIESMKEMQTLEREMKAEIKEVNNKLSGIEGLLTQIKFHNDVVSQHLESQGRRLTETEHIRAEFFKEYGALLPGLKALLVQRPN